MGKNLVIIPTYNEIENIEKMIRKVFSLPTLFNVLIVDDGSPDGTAQKVKQLQAELGVAMPEGAGGNGIAFRDKRRSLRVRKSFEAGTGSFDLVRVAQLDVLRETVGPIHK